MGILNRLGRLVKNFKRLWKFFFLLSNQLRLRKILAGLPGPVWLSKCLAHCIRSVLSMCYSGSSQTQGNHLKQLRSQSLLPLVYFKHQGVVWDLGDGLSYLWGGIKSNLPHATPMTGWFSEAIWIVLQFPKPLTYCFGFEPDIELSSHLAQFMGVCFPRPPVPSRWGFVICLKNHSRVGVMA